MIIIASCGFHVLHGTLRTGLIETDWEINKVLHAIWKIFNESPARRDIYVRETDCDIFPLHFCKTRWVEDEPVAARGIQIWENIVQVVKYWLSLSKNRRPCNNKPVDTLVKYRTGKLVISKLNFLKYIASILRPFLLRFQTNKPIIPTLAVELDVTLRQKAKLFLMQKHPLSDFAT